MQQQSNIQLDGMGTLWSVLDERKRIQLQSELQATIDRWHRQELGTIVNAALVEVQRQQAMKQVREDNQDYGESLS